MANNQMINFNSQDVANMYRRNQLANALQERMNAPTPVHTYQGFQAPISPLTGLTKALDVYSVFQNEKNQEDKYQAEKAAAEQKVLNENSRLEQGRENFVSTFEKPNYSETPMPDSRSSSESGIPLDQPRADVYTATPKTEQEKIAIALSNYGNPNPLIAKTAEGFANQANENIRAKVLAEQNTLNQKNLMELRQINKINEDRNYGLEQDKFNLQKEEFDLKKRTPQIKLTPLEEQYDKKSAEELMEFNINGGFSVVEKSLSQLQSTLDLLKNEPEGSITGDLVSLADKVGSLSYVNKNAQNAKESVEEVVQRNLRLVLGPQFTAKEGEQLISRAYNPALKQSQNAIKLELLRDQIKTAARNKQDSFDYFSRNGTLKGFKGTSYISFKEFLGKYEESIKVQEEKERKKRNTPSNEPAPPSSNQNGVDFNAMVEKHRTKGGN